MANHIGWRWFCNSGLAIEKSQVLGFFLELGTWIWQQMIVAVTAGSLADE